MFSLFLFVINTVDGQKQNNVWIFGNYAGLDFNVVPPKALDSMPLRIDASFFTYTSSFCDTNGKLLLYTDGITVWSRFKIPLERYLGRWPWSGYSMPLIVPHQENDSLYYIFNVSSGSYAYCLQYLTVNIKNNFGYGEILYPQPSTLSNYFTRLKEKTSVLLAGTAHCNRKDIWIVTHSQNAFYSYLITADGVSSTPVISEIQPDIVPEGKYELGNIKFSASGEKLIMPLYNSNEVAVFDFNNLTGAFINGFKLKLPEGLILEDAELSPDGSKLYFGAYSTESFGDGGGVELHSVLQWNLDAGNVSQIEGSLYNVTPLPDRASCSPHICFFINRTLQLGTDGKIYVSMRRAEGNGVQLDKTASVIEYPNELGVQCFYSYNSVNVRRVYSYIDYNYVRSFAYTIKENGIQFKKNICSDQPVNFSLLLTRIDSVSWDFGDPASGSDNFSELYKPSHRYPSSGNYMVKAILYHTCSVDTLYAQVNITKDNSVHLPGSIKDTIACAGNILNINAATKDATNYKWGGGNIQPVQEISVGGTYDVKAMNRCSLDERKFTVQFQKCNCDILLPTAFTPNGDGLNDVFSPVVRCFTENYQFKVFDRFGKIIYESSEPGQGWNGKIKYYSAESGMYIWLLEYKDPNDHLIKQKHGTIVLVY